MRPRRMMQSERTSWIRIRWCMEPDRKPLPHYPRSHSTSNDTANLPLLHDLDPRPNVDQSVAVAPIFRRWSQWQDRCVPRKCATTPHDAARAQGPFSTANSLVYGARPQAPCSLNILLAPIRRPPSQPLRSRITTECRPVSRRRPEISTLASLRPEQLCDHAA